MKNVLKRLIVIPCFIVFAIFFSNSTTINPVDVYYSSLEFVETPEISRFELARQVDEFFNCPKYTLKFTKLSGNTQGVFDPRENCIYLDEDISTLALPRVLAHELVHKTMSLRNEKQVQTITLNLLMKSENPYFTNSAKEEIRYQLAGLYAAYPEYDIRDYLINNS